MQLTKNGYLSAYDTRKMDKYSQSTKDQVCELRAQKISLRRIGETLGLPTSSIFNILKANGLCRGEDKRPSPQYVTRAEAADRYDITSQQFDQARANYKHHTKKVGNTVFLDIQHIEDREYAIGHTLKKITINSLADIVYIDSTRLYRLQKKEPKLIEDAISAFNKLISKINSRGD